MAKSMNVVDMPIGSIKPYPNNPRINGNTIKQVRKSIDTFGWKQPIVVDSDHVIVVGHTRYEAALLRKDKVVPVVVASDLTEDQIRAYRLVDNKVAEASEWDADLLTEEMQSLLAADFDLSAFGFTDEELNIGAVAPVKKDHRWLDDFDVLPKSKPMWVLIRLPEGKAAPLVTEIRNRKIEDCVVHYSGEEPLPVKNL